MKEKSADYHYGSEQEAMETLAANGFRIERVNEQISRVYPADLPANYPEVPDGGAVRPVVAVLRADGSLRFCHANESLIRAYHVRIAQIFEGTDGKRTSQGSRDSIETEFPLEQLDLLVDWCGNRIYILDYAERRHYFTTAELLLNPNPLLSYQLYTRVDELEEKGLLEITGYFPAKMIRGRSVRQRKYGITPLGRAVLAHYRGGSDGGGGGGEEDWETSLIPDPI